MAKSVGGGSGAGTPGGGGGGGAPMAPGGGGGGGIEPPGAGGGAGADDALSTGPPAEMLAAGAGADCASTRLTTAVVDT